MEYIAVTEHELCCIEFNPEFKKRLEISSLKKGELFLEIKRPHKITKLQRPHKITKLQRPHKITKSRFEFKKSV